MCYHYVYRIGKSKQRKLYLDHALDSDPDQIRQSVPRWSHDETPTSYVLLRVGEVLTACTGGREEGNLHVSYIFGVDF